MPRPGPRPYECVRRAWHSDRHQPMRGSLIREIFRVVNEIHSPATGKNKEWQDKLPIVVLKAEEIMYSKANSEAEYMDLKTLWDRANDAINTIIRLDESTETGVFLQPCIEAALILGCTPRKTSRSQRNNTSSYFLNVSGAEPTCSPSNNLRKTRQEAPIAISPLISHYSKIIKPNNVISSHYSLKSHTPLVPSENWTGNKFSLSPSCIPLSDDPQYLCPSTIAPSVYPLYYGNDLRSNDSKISCDTGVMQNLSSCSADTKKEIAQENFRNTRENSPGVECDLSLRLGPCKIAEDFSLQTSQKGSELNDQIAQTNKDISFFSKTTIDNTLDSALNKWSCESEKLDVETALRKRKAVVSHLSEERQFHWRPKVSSNYYAGRMRNAGS